MSVIGPASFGTSFPVSPLDGHVHVLTDSTTASTWQWTFRWNNSSTNADKWELVGGSNASRYEITTFSTSSATDVTDANAPTFTIPRGGVYQLEFGVGISNGSSGSTGTMTLRKAGVNVTGATVAGNGQGFMQGSRLIDVTCATNDVISFVFKSSNASFSQGFSLRWLRVRPIRVS